MQTVRFAALAALLLVSSACADTVVLDVSSRTIDFGEVPVGGASQESVRITLRSAGTAHLTTTLVPDSDVFLVADRTPLALATDGTITLPLRFQPTALGSFLGILAIEVDAVDGSTRVDISLRGSSVNTDRDADRDGVPVEDDCDDSNPAIFPGATEVCDGLDNDCDGALPLVEQDNDSDGFTPCRGDCDDFEATVHPIAPELCDGLDNDCDGALQETDDDNDGERGCDGDCDDGDPLRYTGAPERCNGLDDDCDTVVPTNETDTDNDDWRLCDDDCLDGNATVHPGADELCDGLDTDCDTVIPLDEFDGDTDLFLACEDCNDSNLLIYPGAPELCDELDNDCDTIVPADEVDIDMDNFLACEECDDALATTFPGAPELCDGLDNDCDSVVPAPETTDVDLDNWVLCADCDDNDAAVNPGASEVCDGVDTDCDTLISPDELVDDDFDLYPLCDDCDDTLPGVNPGATEVCDGLDTDCDGVIPATETDDDFDTFIECDGTDCDDGNIDVYLGAPEECYDAVDNDCDTFVNQGCACPIWGTASTTGICAGLGDYDCPYVGAQLAIDAAALDGACNDTWLHPGTYIESLFIEDDGELGSPGPATAVIIDGAASRTVEVDTNVVYTIESVTITGGAASEGAGLLAEDATVELNDVVFDSNACAGGGAGGGVLCDDCSLTVTNSTFIGNSCGYGGGGADNDGGAIHVTGGGSSFISGNIFEGNAAGDGGALWLEEASGGSFHVVTQNHFRENDTSDTGAGFFAFDGGAVAVAGDRVVLTNNVFFDNASTQGAGGVSLSASAGGATYVSNNVFVYNVSGSGQGGGIHLESGTRWNGSPNVHNNVLGWNTGWGIYAESTMPVGVDYNDYTGNSSGAFAAGALFVPSQAGSIFVDPLFVALTDDGDYTNDNFTLQPASQCIDAGNPASFYTDVDTSRNDIGAYGGPLGAW